MIPVGKYSWLNKEPGPKILLEVIKEYGTTEIVGPKHNPKILGWADEIGGWVADYYTNDEIPWCGLLIGVAAKRAGFEFNQKLLGAANWLDWGNPVAKGQESLGDVLVFKRDGGAHVCLYVAEDKDYFHVIGGNQSNQVNIMRIAKNRLTGARRCKWKVSQPSNVRKVITDATGTISNNEA